MKNINLLCLLIIFTLLPAAAAATPVNPSAGLRVNRSILAVYDGSEVKEEIDNLVHHYAEMPLEHLGFKVDYVDVDKRLPDDEEMKKYFGIISWFSDNKLKNAAGYGEWITRQLEKGKKLVVIGDLGFALDANLKIVAEEVMQKFARAFRISYAPGEVVNSPLLIEVVHNDPAMTEFERTLEGEVSSFEGIAALDKTANVYLKLKRRDTDEICDAVFINSRGGFVLSGYDIYLNPIDFQTRWRIDPFKFFAKAFGSDFPKPDITTVTGMRLFYSHIDGDGIRNKSYIDKKTQCGKVTYDRLLTQYKLPVSVSVVIGDIMLTSGAAKERLIATIRKMFALPNVWPASHGWAHPYVWSKNKRKMGIKLTGYEYSPQNEIGNSLDYINEHLAPADKKANLFLWTGDCQPDYEALKYVYDHGLMNLNGGDTRFDNEYPSYTYVAPLFRHVDGLLQYYATNSNENTYTNLWTGPFYGYKYVVETYKRTESPMRIRPIDVYYHFYTAEHATSLDAMRSIYDWALKQEIAPIFVRDYIKVVDGFLSTKIDKVSPEHWIVSNNGELRTMRFDDQNGYVDMNGSKGVLGFMRHQGSLYVTLDDGQRSEIRLTGAPPQQPVLAKANGTVTGWKKTADKMSFKLRTIGRVHFVIDHLARGKTYRIDLDGTPYDVKSDKDGTLVFYTELPGREYVVKKVEIKKLSF